MDLKVDLDAACQETTEHVERIGPAAAEYWRFHAPRFRFIAGTLTTLAATIQSKSESPLRILDIGNSCQTILLRKLLPHAQLDTLGYFDCHYPATPTSLHYEYDLNEANEPSNWIKPEGGPYHMIVFLEVLEHLHTSPLRVLAFLRTFLHDRGCLALQTPNAAALWKRVRLLKGYNPYEPIRLSRIGPGHFREYTVKELKNYSQEVGLEVERAQLANHFAHLNPFPRRWQRISEWLPSTHKESITLILRKAENHRPQGSGAS